MGSVTEWEIDGKGVVVGGEKYVVVDCRCYSSKRQSQGQLASLAFQIKELGANGGIIVSPHDLQSGARKVAMAENIIPVKLTPNSTNREYMMSFLNKMCVGLSDSIAVGGSIASVEVVQVGKK